MDCHFPGPGSLEAPGECALRTRQAHLSRPEVGAGAGARWDVHGAARRPGRRDASALSVPARSPIPAAAHTRAPRVHAPPPAPTRPRSRPPGCPHPAGVPQARRESVPWSSTGAGGGGEGGSPIVGGRGGKKKQATAGASRHRGAPGWVMRRASAAPGSARRGPARHASEASVSRAGGLAGELKRKQAPRSRLGALAAQTRSPRELLFSLV